MDRGFNVAALAQDILDFWFSEKVQKLWFNSNSDFDKKIQFLFEPVYHAGAKGELKAWEESAQGALALVILFDQFPLNMYRGDKKGFETESLSRDVAQAAIDRGFDQSMTGVEKAFLYMPFMHSENEQDQVKAVDLFGAADLDDNLRFAKHHQEIIRRFGRFPHRNKILGRKSTVGEIKYLASDSAFLG